MHNCIYNIIISVHMWLHTYLINRESHMTAGWTLLKPVTVRGKQITPRVLTMG